MVEGPERIAGCHVSVFPFDAAYPSRMPATIAHVTLRNGTGSYLTLSITLLKAIGPAKPNISRDE